MQDQSGMIYIDNLHQFYTPGKNIGMFFQVGLDVPFMLVF